MARAKFPAMPKAGGAQPRSAGGAGAQGGARGGKSANRGGMRQARGGLYIPGRQGGAALNTDGYPVGPGGAEFESDILGGNSYYSEADGQTYHGQEAIDMYERDHPGENGPHDGITGESGMYWGDGSFRPSNQG